MQLTYTKYEQPIAVNLWLFTIEWMSGENDDFKYVTYKFKNEEDFIKGYQFFNKVIAFRNNHKYEFRMLNLNGSVDELRDDQQYMKFYYHSFVIIKEFLGKYKSLNEMFLVAGIDAVSDTVRGDIDILATPTEIKDTVHYDGNGIKFNIKINE